MAKMDEIMEVLTQEIAGFNTSIAKLEKLSEKFKNLEVEMDTSKLEFRLDDFIKTQKRTIESYENRMEQVLKKIEKSRWTPKWEVAVIYIVMCLNTIAFSYLGYYFVNYEQKKEAAVAKGKEEGLGKARGYFDDHPIIYKDFERWAKRKDSVPNQE
ncbi:DUF6730 family protein [Ulvibacterium marinum]|uniref:Uncharacterized protein n=1 Tax=Ulvibacterium marinum TaxID=2419782 RepID=A0A3B0BWZ0_9FLAO|nr:DUF6730 family protein [Ulvibacterium marinum]RKN77985.1 hypothetical protein D7Z94_22470 [Ulvibacterium marinum]